MVIVVPESFEDELSVIGKCLGERSLGLLGPLSMAQLLAEGQRQVTELLRVSGLSEEHHHSIAYRFFKDHFQADEVGLAALGELVKRHGLRRIVLVGDRTLFRRFGRQVHDAHLQYDALVKTGGKRVGFGTGFNCLGPIVRIPGVGRAVCVPLQFRQCPEPVITEEERAKASAAGRKPKKRQSPTDSEAIAEMTRVIHERFPDLEILVVVDGGYKASVIRETGAHVIAHIRTDASLEGLAPERPEHPDAGHPVWYGPNEHSEAQKFKAADVAANDSVPWVTHPSQENRQYKTIDARWRRGAGPVDLRVVISRDHENGSLFVLISTDLSMTGEQIITAYLERWSIEVAFEDAKGPYGVGHHETRLDGSVQNGIAFGFLTMAMTMLWYASHGNPEQTLKRARKRNPWDVMKKHITTSDILHEARAEIMRCNPPPQNSAQPGLLAARRNANPRVIAANPSSSPGELPLAA
jgi:hypothetical protein